MRTVADKVSGYALKGELYDSPAEFLRINDQRSCVYDDRDFLSENSVGDAEFYGFENGKQLRADFSACKADAKAIEQVKSAVKVTQTADKKRVQFFNDVVGFAPVVPLALMGVSEAMVNQRTVKIKSKVLDVYIDCTASCKYSCGELAKAGKTLIEQVIGLELAGYRVSITAMFISVMTHDIACVGVKIKDAGQPLDVARCIYPFVNPAFMRGICFGWYQRNGKIEHQAGYGCTIWYKGTGLIKGFKSVVCGKNGVFLGIAKILEEGGSEVTNALSEYCKQ